MYAWKSLLPKSVLIEFDNPTICSSGMESIDPSFTWFNSTKTKVPLLNVKLERLISYVGLGKLKTSFTISLFTTKEFLSISVSEIHVNSFWDNNSSIERSCSSAVSN